MFSKAPTVNDNGDPEAGGCTVTGRIFCLNTIEQMSTFDRQSYTDHATNALWSSIQDGKVLQYPALLQQTVILSYCDLKQYKYYFWLAFPVLQPPTPFVITRAACSLSAHLTDSSGEHNLQVANVIQAVTAYFGSIKSQSSPCALLSVSSHHEGSAAVHPLTAWQNISSSSPCRKGNDQLLPYYFCFIDPSNSSEHPGWPLRNALVMAAAMWGPCMLRVLCLRTRTGRYDADASIVLEVKLPSILAQPKSLGGWEVNPKTGKPGPRVSDLGALMDPKILAASAVDLNLQLMRWRAAPSLNIASISRTKCLLLGAGTLGCSVARTLLGYGVRKITFVDNGKVAYSNPVRQSLFEFKDCLQGGRPKAHAAAEAVRRIFPDVDAVGVDLTIPMPGHAPTTASEVEGSASAVALIEELIASHDAVFLLLDTREARWVPTIICAALGKIAITGALGFDSFLAMRHGHLSSEVLKESLLEKKENEEATVASPPPSRLGCYFCSDIVGPANSTVDRTMDQQCTVARPGLSAMCGSVAAEMFAALVQHPAGAAAPASSYFAQEESNDGRKNEKDSESEMYDPEPPLGQVPHMVRGQLTGFSQVCLTGQAFSQCPACSLVALQEYCERGVDFILQAISQPHYLEDLTGLTELHRASEAMLEGAGARGEEDNEHAEGSDVSGGDWEEL